MQPANTIDQAVEPRSSRGVGRRESLITAAVVTLLTAVSLFAMLHFASPELYWDEAQYVLATAKSWNSLWNGSDYIRHSHGPMAIYLAKLGYQILPAATASVEVRLRFFEALFGSLGIGMLYWILRRCFSTSRAAAITASALLLFSVIRLQETTVIGPHHLILACMLAIFALGYRWRDRPSMKPAIVLGAITGFAAVSMTYIVPVMLCWLLAIALIRGKWIVWDGPYLKVSQFFAPMLAVALVTALVLWPPGVWDRVFLADFIYLLHYPFHPTLVAGLVYQETPRWAVIYWLSHLDAPILIFCTGIILIGLWRALAAGRLRRRHVYVLMCAGFMLLTALTSYLAGARNILLVMALFCVAAGVLFDNAIGRRRPCLRVATAAAIVLVSLFNLVWLARDPNYIPYISTTGYRAFLRDNRARVSENSKAVVSGVPIIEFYAREDRIPVSWHATEMAWTTRADAPFPDHVKYVLIPGFVFDHMPADQPMRRIVASHWKLLWSYKQDHVWELRLYENPEFAGTAGLHPAAL